MRIVYLNPTGRFGGAESLLLDLLASVREARPEWGLVLVVPEPGILSERASALGVAIQLLPLPDAVARLGDAGMRGRLGRLSVLGRMCGALPAALLYQRRLKASLRRWRPDIVHSNGLKMHWLSVWSRPKRARVIWHVHDFLSSRPVMAHLLRRAAPRCFAAVAVSEHVRRDINQVCPSLPVRMVRNAIDLHEFRPDGPACDLDSLSGLPRAEHVVRVGLVATMARWKGQQVFLEALRRMRADVPVRAYVIGDAIYQTNQSQWCLQQLRALACELGLADKVGFTGFVARPAEAYRALDVVVHASTEAEPFGLVIAEAMSCGKAVIASSLGGPAEFVQHEITGLVHAAGNTDDLARQIDRFVLDSGLRHRLGREARSVAVRAFDRRRLATELLPIYEAARAGHEIDAELVRVDLETRAE